MDPDSRGSVHSFVDFHDFSDDNRVALLNWSSRDERGQKEMCESEDGGLHLVVISSVGDAVKAVVCLVETVVTERREVLNRPLNDCKSNWLAILMSG